VGLYLKGAKAVRKKSTSINVTRFWNCSIYASFVNVMNFAMTMSLDGIKRTILIIDNTGHLIRLNHAMEIFTSIDFIQYIGDIRNPLCNFFLGATANETNLLILVSS
jgi:hypothetical protein